MIPCTHTQNREIFVNNKFHELASNLVGRKIRESHHRLFISILWNVCRNIRHKKTREWSQFAKNVNIIDHENFPI